MYPLIRKVLLEYVVLVHHDRNLCHTISISCGGVLCPGYCVATPVNDLSCKDFGYDKVYESREIRVVGLELVGMVPVSEGGRNRISCLLPRCLYLSKLDSELVRFFLLDRVYCISDRIVDVDIAVSHGVSSRCLTLSFKTLISDVS